ncbi:MAG: U32 family peptidase, partial [Gammaproteobacteria bacterium]|nr:U32 family peptidase [Gammaproteobacteria bacterium]
SAKRFDLLDQVSTMRDIGVDALRISPTQTDMSGVIARFHQAITEPQSMTTNAQHINLVDADSHCNGYWFGQPGMDQRAIELNE